MSEPEIHVDPDRLRAIAEELGMFSNDVKAELAVMEAALARLGHTWQDDEYQKFKKAMVPLRRLLDEFHGEIAKSQPAMLADAETIRAYQKLKAP